MPRRRQGKRVFRVSLVATLFGAVIWWKSYTDLPALVPALADGAAPSSVVAVAPTPQPSAVAGATTPATTPPAMPVIGLEQVIGPIGNRQYAEALVAIQQGASVKGSVNGLTALAALNKSSPCYYGDPNPPAYELLKEIIKNGDGLDEIQPDKRLLWHAVLYNLQNNDEKFAEILVALLARGIDLNQLDGRGKPVLDWNWPPKIVALLEKHGACSMVFADPSHPRCDGARQR